MKSRKLNPNLLAMLLFFVFCFYLFSGCVGPAAMRGVWLRASFPIKVAAIDASCYPATDAAHYWNESTGLHLFDVACVQSTESAPRFDVLAQPELTGVCSELHKVLGCTHRSFTHTDTPYRATVDVDHARLDKFDPWAEDGPWDGHDPIERVYRHEFGHVLGLSHATGTVMDEWRMVYYASDDQIDLLRRVYK